MEEQKSPKLVSLLKRYWRWLLGLAVAGVLAVLTLVVVCWQLITPSGRYILNSTDTSAIKIKDTHVGLVLGAGVDKNGKPFKELQARLDIAATGLQKGWVDKLILSGDNRFKNYDEPTAMRNYLVQKYHIDDKKLVRDFAGRSTYESCERAAKIFGQRRLAIFSAGTHLPRAIYLCRHFGIESYGIVSTVEANNSHRREILARVKAIYNIYIRGEKTVLGKPLPI